MTQCPRACGGRINRDGKRHGKSGTVQTYLCRGCGARFTDRRDTVVQGGRSNPTIIAAGVGKYGSGGTCRSVASELRVSPTTVWRWVGKYSVGGMRTKLLLAAMRERHKSKASVELSEEMAGVSADLRRLAAHGESDSKLAQVRQERRLNKPNAPVFIEGDGPCGWAYVNGGADWFCGRNSAHAGLIMSDEVPEFSVCPFCTGAAIAKGEQDTTLRDLDGGA